MLSGSDDITRYAPQKEQYLPDLSNMLTKHVILIQAALPYFVESSRNSSIYLEVYADQILFDAVGIHRFLRTLSSFDAHRRIHVAN